MKPAEANRLGIRKASEPLKASRATPVFGENNNEATREAAILF